MWSPPWRPQRLGYFTSPRTIEYRLTRRELAILFNREEHEVPGGFCTDVGSMEQYLRAQQTPTVDQTMGWGVVETAPVPRISPEERARQKIEVAEIFLRRIDLDRQRWLANGGSADTFSRLKICTQLDDPGLSRTVRVDTRAHEHLHSKSNSRDEKQDLKLLKYLEGLFEAHGEDRSLPLALRNFSMEKGWSANGHFVEEVLARVAGYEAAERDALTRGRRAEDLKLLNSEYGGRDFTAFRAALKRMGYTPARVLREALR